ncbi:MAG: hypothetical protein HY744_00105 [Deltaproteobacteria bacterium]|nr:hypothetical protein [Deltaproteobacteria bacterium]
MRPRHYLFPLCASSVLGALCVRAVLRRAGEPALPLDDAFIHLQYARRLAEGHFFSYVPGQGYSSGATSWLWPALLTPFFAGGVHGLGAIWVLWALGTLLHAALAVEAARLASGLAGRAGAIGAGAMCLAFGAFAWFAWAGMETVALGWILMRTARVAAEHGELVAAGRSPGAPWQAVALGAAAPLVRPEGVLGSVIALCAVLGWARALGPGRRRAAAGAALVPCAGAMLQPLVNLALTGRAASSTAQVKWLALDPYVDARLLAQATLANARLLVTDLLDGGAWTALFVPRGFLLALALGIVATAFAGWRRRRGARAGFVLLLVLGTLVPCMYGTMLWNRVRYLWPFAPAWLVAVACLGAEVGVAAGRLRPGLGALGPALLGAAVGWLAAKLPWTVADLAQSAHAIARQQVALGRWAARALPAHAAIGVNDTGAIAYLSERPTFDIVGLTTPGEARYWPAGAGSRFEHYERLGPRRLPSHFIVYPEWMACPPLLGPALSAASVYDQTILGGATMVAYEARYDLLGSGQAPFSRGPRTALLDEIDVADLESEREHRYSVGPARAVDDRAGVALAPDGRLVADGGRFERAFDRFELRLRPGEACRLGARFASPVDLDVWVGSRHAGVLSAAAAPPGAGLPEAAPDAWLERWLSLPPDAEATRSVTVRPAGPARFASFHYWCFAETG